MDWIAAPDLSSSAGGWSGEPESSRRGRAPFTRASVSEGPAWRGPCKLAFRSVVGLAGAAFVPAAGKARTQARAAASESDAIWEGISVQPLVRQGTGSCARALLILIALISLLGTGCSLTLSKRNIYHLEHTFPVDDPSFRRSLDTFGTIMVGGNTIETL